MLYPPRIYYCIIYTDINNNTSSVLNGGELLSRTRAENAGLIKQDSGSAAIVAGLEEGEKDYVRLYFRPRAPTQHANEGVRPSNKIQFDAHMPVPVYLLFDSREVLTLAGTRFTQGRFTHIVYSGDTAQFLENINFKLVYHDRGFSPQMRDEIVDARHAEVLVPYSLSLDHLRWIVCRTAPERETLLNLLDEGARKRWAEKIVLEEGQYFFFKRGTFVQSVALAEANTRIEFSPHTEEGFDGPFALNVRWRGRGGWNASFAREGYCLDPHFFVFNLGSAQPEYVVSATLDGHLVYQARFVASTGPELI